MRYNHTQAAPLYLLLVVCGLIMVISVAFIPQLYVQLILLVSGGLMIGLALAFRELTICDEGDRLLIAFGPLPVFRRRVPYADIERVEPARSSILDGWGIHLSPSGGWTWNLWGFDCVDVFLTRGRKIRIGTDDRAGLAAFLQKQVTADDTSR